MFKALNSVIDSMQTEVGFLVRLLNAMPLNKRKKAKQMKLNGITLQFLNSTATVDTVDLLVDFTKDIK